MEIALDHFLKTGDYLEALFMNDKQRRFLMSNRQNAVLVIYFNIRWMGRSH